MKKLSSLSFFFPCLNDGKSIPDLVAKGIEVARSVSLVYEIIIIENGSSDSTLNALFYLQKRYPKVRIIRYPNPLGYGGVLQAGFKHAKFEWVFYTDGDGQYDPLELIRLVEKVEDGISVVNGYKINRGDTWYRNMIGNLYKWFLHYRFHPPIRDVDCDFRLIRRLLLKEIHLKSLSGLGCLELVMKLKKKGATFAEVGVSHYPRRFGRSEFFRVTHIMNTLKELWRYSILEA